MSSNVLAAVIREVMELESDTVEFLWHGGEPLLAGIKLFREALQLQRELNVQGKVVRNSVQTNGVCLDEEWADLFKQHQFVVGLSIDAPSDIHDKYRIGVLGSSTYDAVASRIALLVEREVPFGAIVVINKEHVDRHKEVLATLGDIGITSFDIHPSCANGVSDQYAVSPYEFGRFCCALFDAWLDKEDSPMLIETFVEVLRFLRGLDPRICYFAGACSSIIAVEANGDVIPCTRPFDKTLWTFGNITRDKLGEILTRAPFQEFVNQDLAAQKRAMECRWFGLCHNGCPQHRRHMGQATVSGAGMFCDCDSDMPVGLPAIFDHIQRRVTGLLQ